MEHLRLRVGCVQETMKNCLDKIAHFKFQPTRGQRNPNQHITQQTDHLHLR